MTLTPIFDPGRFGRVPFVKKDGTTSSDGTRFLDLLLLNIGGPNVRQVGAGRWFTTVVGQASVASAAEATLLNAATKERWLPRDIFLSGDGTNFSGGDRDLSVTDNTSTWTVIPAATLQSLATGRWGDTGVPFPSTAGHLTTASTSGANIVAKYSGGSTDYTAGSCTLVLMAERVV